MLFDLANTIAAMTTTLTPGAAVTAAVNGAGVTSSDGHSITHVIQFGASGDTLSGSVYFDVTLQDSPDGSTWTDVTDNDYVVGGTVAAGGIWATVNDPAEDDQVYFIGYRGPQPYSRIQIEKTGTHSNGTVIGAIAIKGDARKVA